MADQFETKKIASETGLTNEIVVKYQDMGDGTHALVMAGTGGGGGGGGASLADTSVVDADGVYWLVRDNGITLIYKNWATGLTGTPTAPVEPVGAGAGNEISSANYTAVTAGTGYSIGDVIQRIVVLDLTNTPAVVVGSTWVNLTTGAIISAPNMAHFNLSDDQNVSMTSVDIGTQADAPAGTDTGTFSMLALLKRMLTKIPVVGRAAMAASLPVVIASDQPAFAVTSSNITTKFREAFEVLDPARWTTVIGSGDIVQVDGNTAAASYLEISKSPWIAGNETTLETISTFEMPIEIAFGMSRSQNTVGQEFSFEFVDTSAPLADVSDIAISSITQATTILTVDTVADHGLTVGKCIGIKDCSNQIANYPALVIASIPSPRQFTCTAGPGGTIPSQTITNPGGAKGSVFFRERLGRAKNGISQIFENASATQASMYLRSESGDALPSGTVAGAHVITVGSTAPVQLVNTPYSYAFVPTSEYRINMQADRLQFADGGIDSVSQTSSRLLRTQVIPDPSETYKLRIRANNADSLSVLNSKVVSVSKPGTTVGTFTTATPHGLVTGDLIVYYGNSNTAASAFPNLTTATAVTVTGANTFTVAAIGTAATVTGYGGVISKVQGGNLLSALGANAVTGISSTLSTLTDGTRQLALTGSGSWAGLTIGDYVEVAGVSNVTDGALLGVDGAWKVANIVTTVLTLVPCTAAFAATLPANFGTTNSAGAVVKRTSLRISFIRIFDYERERVEVLARPSGDASGAVPTVVQSGTVAVSSLPTLAAVTALSGGGVAEDAAAGANPLVTGGVVRTARAPVTFVAGDAARHTMTTEGSMTVQPGPVVPLIEVASAARTTTGNSGVISVAAGGGMSGLLLVTAASGTTPTLDLALEESYDNGTTFHQIWAAPRFVTTGNAVIPPMLTAGLRRWVWTITGTTPSFTFAITANAVPTPSPIVRQLFDRTANVLNGTISTPTAAIPFTGCKAATAKVTLGAAGTPATYQWQVSDDNVNFANVGTATAAVANATTAIAMPAGITANWARLIVTVAGATQTGTVVALNATS